MEFVAADKPFSIYAVVQSIAVVAPVAGCANTLVYISRRCRNQNPVRILGPLSDHVDDPVYRVCPPDSAARPPNDLDPLDILQQCVLHLPIDTSKERRIDAPPINQHQQRFGELAAESANTYRPMIGIRSRHFDTRGQPQDLRYAGCSRPSYVLLCDDVNRRRSLPHLLRLFRRSCNFHIAKLFQTQFLQASSSRLVSVWALSPTSLQRRYKRESQCEWNHGRDAPKRSQH